MIFGIGIDIVEVATVANSIEDYKERYLEKLFTSQEIQYCSAFPTAVQSYAARIAAKEAAMKALSTGLENGVDWLDFEVVNEPSGQPILLAYGVAAQLIKANGISKLWVSLAHIPDYAIAQVILEK